MTKKPFSDIENIIRDASNASEPAFEEVSWQKMEALLDKDKKRRPFIFWFLLILGLFTAGALVWKWPAIMMEKTSQPAAGKSIVQKENTPAKNATSLQSDVPGDKGNTAPVGLQQPGSTPFAMQEESSSQTKNTTTPQTKVVVDRGTAVPVSTQKPGRNPLISENENRIKTRDVDKSNKRAERAVVIGLPAEKYAETKNTNKKNIIVNEGAVRPGSENDSLKSLTIVSTLTDSGSAGISLNTMPDSTSLAFEAAMDSSFPQKKEIKPKTSSRFFITASLGTETSGTTLFKGGKNTVKWGLGAGYQLTKNLGIQAAFYKSEKKYAAAGAAYKTTAGTYWSIVDIKSVNADCIVYEIPVTLQYDFSPAKKLHFYAAAGLSSYIMKKEDYKYYYLRNGSPYYGAATYSGNQHLFSVAKLAAGISYQLNNRVILTSSPSLNIPLKGVGEGQIKLYSKEFNFGIRYFPLHKK